MVYLHEIKDLPTLRVWERETIREIERLKAKPAIVQAETGNALGARLKSIRRKISEMELANAERIKN